MDSCLIAVGWSDPRQWFALLEVCLGLGFVIFVHELGHFLVAKSCGVKVDKFFIGFDIAGLKLFSFRWGETLYGIGILPLGGYVKMLGQEDNPAALRKEMERARENSASGSNLSTSDTASRDTVDSDQSGSSEPSPEKRLYDPRSYLAKSVPQRMAIISAGVIMNMIFAIVFAVIAFLLGVKQNPTVVGSVVAGGAAWQAGVQADDKVLKVGDRTVYNFLRMTGEIVTDSRPEGIPLLIERPGVDKPMEIVVKPEQLGGKPTIGILSSAELKLRNEKNILPYWPDTAAANAKGPLKPGDRIVQIDGQAIGSYGQLQDFLEAHAQQDLAVSVARLRDPDAQSAQPEDTEKVQLVVPKSPMKQFGMVLEMGPVSAIETHSPAAAASVQPGDLLKSIAGQPVADPMKLPELLHKRAGKEVELGLLRGGKPIDVKVKLSTVIRYLPPEMPDSPMAIAELGLAYHVLNTVAHVESGSPAAEAGIQAGDRITSAKIIPPSPAQLDEVRKKCNNKEIEQREATLPFAETERNWPYFMLNVQATLPGTAVEFKWKRGEQEMTGKTAPALARDWFDSQRGWNLEPMMFMQRADSFADALRLGGEETGNATLLVYRSLHSVGTNRISVRNIAGPWGIILEALRQARLGLGNLLIFLTLLSANLAVINFLPIPVLDGGHMVLLLYEGIRGKPADERVQEVLTWIGLILILTLMVWAFGLDLGWIARPGAH